MGKSAPVQLIKIKKIVADIRDFPAKIDSPELAKNVRCLLKKYAVLSEKIERNVLIRDSVQKDLAAFRTVEFKTLRRTLKEKANSVLHEKKNKKVQSAEPAKKAVKKAAPKKATKTADAAPAKETKLKKAVKKPAAKTTKAKAPKADTAE